MEGGDTTNEILALTASDRLLAVVHSDLRFVKHKIANIANKKKTGGRSDHSLPVLKSVLC